LSINGGNPHGLGHSPIKINPLPYGHCFIEIDSNLRLSFTIGIKGWEATFLAYVDRMVLQQWGTILFVIFLFQPLILSEDSPNQIMMNIENIAFNGRRII